MQHVRLSAGLAILAGVTTLGLTGCGGGGGSQNPGAAGGHTPPATSAPSLPGSLAPSSSPPSSAALSPADQKLISKLAPAIPVVATEPKPFIKVGHAACQAVQEGASPKQVTTTLYKGTKKLAQKSSAQTPLSQKQAKAIVDSSVAAYCPKASKHAGKNSGH
jgi:hypothetical protein